MRVFRRRAVAAVRVEPSAGQPAQLLRVVPIDLYCFFDIDVSLLNVEVEANDLLPSRAHKLLYRFGRACAPGCCAGFAPGLRRVCASSASRALAARARPAGTRALSRCTA